MKAAPLALCLVWAAQARADTAVPAPEKRVSWADSCAARLDAAAKALGFKPGARVSPIPLRHEDGTPNPVQYVKYVAEYFEATAGQDSERRPDVPWQIDRGSGRDHATGLGDSVPRGDGVVAFRRLHHHFGKIEGSISATAEREFRRALDDCLNMGETK